MASVVTASVALRLMPIAAAMATAGERRPHRSAANHDAKADRNRNLTDLTDPG
jgi:hypothetical protein